MRASPQPASQAQPLRADRIGLRAAACVAAIAALTVSIPAYAEFELKGARVDRGEVEIEYRGSLHGNLPEADEDAPVRQSHDIEYEVGVTDMFAVSAVATVEELDGQAFEYAATTVETQIELFERKNFAVSILSEYQAMRDGSEADEFEIGPVANILAGKFDLLTNTFLTREMGRFAETDSWGLQYDVRARYWQTQGFAFGMEFHGELEELDNTGPFSEQEHYLGPVLYWKLGDDADDEKAGAVRGPAPKSYGLALGAMFGLTDVTSEAALKVQANIEF